MIYHSIILQMNATKSKLISNPKMITAKDKRASDKERSTNVSSIYVTETSKAKKDRYATINSVVKSPQLSFPTPVR